MSRSRVPDDLEQAMVRGSGGLGKSVNRRDFLKFSAMMAGVLALPMSSVSKISAALESSKRLPVIWLNFQDCTGCTESFLRASQPSTIDILLDKISLEYAETIMAASGKQAELSRKKAIEEGGYLLIVEGAVPMNENGAYCCIGGMSARDIVEECAKNAKAIIAVGNCAAYGNVPAANPNPTGAIGIRQLLSKNVIALAGCPTNAVNLAATLVHYLTFDAMPDVDVQGRPLFAHGKRIHDNCERRAHFDAGQYVEVWGDEGHRKGWCLYKMGCKGPEAYHNCPSVRWNDGTSWPVAAGHGCIACASPSFWDRMAPMYKRLPDVPGLPVEATVDKIGIGLMALTGVGVAAHAAGSVLRKRGQKQEQEQDSGH